MVTETGEPFFALDPVELDIGFGAPLRQRRGSIALRGLLLIPLLVLVGALGVVCALLAVIGWFAALVLGRLPRWIAAFELKAISYSVGVNAYVFLLVDKYPPFALSPADYPLTVKVGASRLSRGKVFFRWLLFIPAAIVSGIAGNGLLLLSPIIWLVTLVRGRPPQPIFSAAAAVIRYQARYYAYMSLVTDMYPRRLFGDSDSDWVGGVVSATEGERPRDLRLPLSRGGHRLVVLIIALGIVAGIGSIVLRVESRPASSDGALVPAENRLEQATKTYLNSVQGCLRVRGAHAQQCLEAHDRAWGEAFDQFSSSLERVSYAGSYSGEASALAHDARTIGATLLAASKEKTLAGHTKALLRLKPLLQTFDADAKSLLGHGL